jgi:hypothetical protein
VHKSNSLAWNDSPLRGFKLARSFRASEIASFQYLSPGIVKEAFVNGVAKTGIFKSACGTNCRLR